MEGTPQPQDDFEFAVDSWTFTVPIPRCLQTEGRSRIVRAIPNAVSGVRETRLKHSCRRFESVDNRDTPPFGADVPCSDPVKNEGVEETLAWPDFCQWNSRPRTRDILTIQSVEKTLLQPLRIEQLDTVYCNSSQRDHLGNHKVNMYRTSTNGASAVQYQHCLFDQPRLHHFCVSTCVSTYEEMRSNHRMRRQLDVS
jgi:hypothetical protein